jgi:two-component system chemotaxis sensor kinase CheA
MHLVRNAMDHGIETAEERAGAGKPPRGELRLHAYHDSGSIVIEVSDDGRGLNMERILAKAQEKGLVGVNQTLSHAEIQRLIFEPGITTASQITNLSGRGVGMDVVRKNIEALRGTVDIASSQGAGTTITIRLPLTLAIIDGFLVGVGSSSYVVPLDTVIECIEMNGAHASGGDATYINLRGEVLPFIRLHEMFGESRSSGRENIVVVQYGAQKAGLVVDELLGEFQTVIKPLGKIFQRLSGVSGATILGSGDVAVILDVPQLIQAAAERKPVGAPISVTVH